MKNAVNLYRGHSSTLQRRQQNAAQCVAQGQAIATLERLGNNGCQEARVITRLDLEFGRLDKFLPVFLNGHVFVPSAIPPGSIQCRAILCHLEKQVPKAGKP